MKLINWNYYVDFDFSKKNITNKIFIWKFNPLKNYR
jgi:hypothetical protein